MRWSLVSSPSVCCPMVSEGSLTECRARHDGAGITDFARVWVWIAVAVWLIVFAGMLRRAPSLAQGRDDKRMIPERTGSFGGQRCAGIIGRGALSGTTADSNDAALPALAAPSGLGYPGEVNAPSTTLKTSPVTTRSTP